jgi:hypothetical protein
MCPNIVQRTVAAVDLASAQLAQRNTSCLRQPIREMAVNAIITRHLAHALDAIENGDRETFERRCERAGRIARWHAPDRLGDVEEILREPSKYLSAAHLCG